MQPHGGASFAGIVTVGGDLNVTGDYSVDEISARNLSLTGIATTERELHYNLMVGDPLLAL